MGIAAASSPQGNRQRLPVSTEQVRVKRETIQSVLDQCQRALKLLEDPDLIVDAEPDVNAGLKGNDKPPLSLSAADADADADADVLCEMVKSRVESQSFLEKLGSMQVSVSHSDSAWEMVGTADLWENKQFGTENKDDLDGYVLINQEDIVEGIASFMAAYILSLKDAKELAPNQLQKALSKTFSVKKKKSKLMKAWEGSQVIYNVTSWGATAVGLCCPIVRDLDSQCGGGSSNLLTSSLQQLQNLPKPSDHKGGLSSTLVILSCHIEVLLKH